MAPAGEKKRFGFMRRGKPEADLTAEADGDKAPSGESSSLVPPLSRDKDEKPPGDTAEPSTPKDEPPPPKPATPRTPREEVNGAGVESADVEAASSADGTGETAARATDTPGGTVTDSTGHGREVPRHRLGGRVRACGRRPDARHARAPQVDAGRAHSEVGAIGASYRRRHYT